jgi:hypothetical protein
MITDQSLYDKGVAKLAEGIRKLGPEAAAKDFAERFAKLMLRKNEFEALLREAQVYCPHDPVQCLLGDRIQAALDNKG